MGKMVGIADETVVILALPHGSGAFEELVDFMGCEGLPRVDNAGQRPALPGFDHCVNMVGHHAPGDKRVALLVEMQQGVFDDGCGAGIT